MEKTDPKYNHLSKENGGIDVYTRSKRGRTGPNHAMHAVESSFQKGAGGEERTIALDSAAPGCPLMQFT